MCECRIAEVHVKGGNERKVRDVEPVKVTVGEDSERECDETDDSDDIVCS